MLFFGSRTTPVIFQPVRGVQRQEAKRYYAEDGTADPPVQVVIDRFKRLRWGAFIHPRAGRRKHLYRYLIATNFFFGHSFDRLNAERILSLL